MSNAIAREVPGSLATWMQPFRSAFTAPTWNHVLVLVMGAILVPGRRTVASALRLLAVRRGWEWAYAGSLRSSLPASR